MASCYNNSYYNQLYESLPTRGTDYSPEERVSVRFESLQDERTLERNNRRELDYLVTSRLDSTEAQLLQHQYGFPRRMVARALLLRFESFGDDFKSFAQFYQACVDVALTFGLQPPKALGKVIITDKSRVCISRLDDLGYLRGEESHEISFTEYYASDKAPAQFAGGNIGVKRQKTHLITM